MPSSNRPSESIIPPLKKRLKKVLRPAARQALPTLARIAGTKLDFAQTASTKSLEGFIHGYRAIEREFPEANSAGNGAGKTPPSKAAVQLKVQAAKRAKASAGYVDSLSRGTSVEGSILTGTRELIKGGQLAKAVAVGHSLRARPESRNIGAAVLGVSLLASSGPENAWSVFSEIANTTVSELVADELYTAAFGALGSGTSTVLEADMSAGHLDGWATTAIFHVAQKALARGLNDQARHLINLAQKRQSSSLTPHENDELARLATWLPEGSHRAPIPVVENAINFGIVNYQQPGTTSRNIGDYIQTLASMGHVARQRNFTYAGDPDLVGFFQELRDSTKPERFVDGPSVKLNLLELYRDGSPYQSLPEPTWSLTFGWHMTQTFGQGYGIPFHPNLRPILISIYVRHPEILTPDAIAYLQRYAPVGCRDWQTVALLRAVGVPAFFSGCMTTTVDTVFRRDGADDRNDTIYVDSPQTGPGDFRTQAQKEIRSLTFRENLELARSWVSDYHLKYNTVVTKRLHCYLPARSVGSSVVFLPNNRSDNRFGGLIDTSEEAFERIRQGILDKVSIMLQAIGAGHSEEAIYTKWREICAPDMAEADRRLGAAKLLATDASRTRDVLSVNASATRREVDPDAINVLIDVRAGEGKHLKPVLRSLVSQTERELVLWLTGDSVGTADRQAIEALGLSARINWLDVDRSALDALRGSSDKKADHELVLSLSLAALEGISTVVFLPASALVRGDVAGLIAQAPSDGEFLSARNDLHKERNGGLEMIRRVALRQGSENEKALNFIFATHQTFNSDFRLFDPTVMVLDVAAVTAQGFAERLTSLVLEYNLTYREALNTLVGPRRRGLADEWNYGPAYEMQEDPALVNWRESSKPWSGLYVPFADEYNALQG